MKKIILATIVSVFAVITLAAFNIPSQIYPAPQDKPVSIFPEDVAKIIETSCFDCHSDAASNAKAKMKLNFSKWGELTDAKKVGKMTDINDVIKNNDMPPGKYLEKHPESALNADQKAIVEKWIAEESKKLMGE